MYTKFSSFVLTVLLAGWLSSADALAGSDYMHVERSQDDSDLRITSIGAFGLSKDTIGHVDLSYIESVGDGEALAIDLGAGISKTLGATFFIGVGVLLGYNWDESDSLSAYYSEAGVFIPIIGDSFGLTVTEKRYYELASPNDNESIIMFGLLFSGD
ncbi:MAG: hypothetical protein COA99_14480 [Moraxellaceae bacterium]|nr:MAG: hypothetical protein COA99_14480 [Moraxellaceae bacterium]